MKSMTGFGAATATDGKFEVCAEVSSVNRKGLEVSVSLPREFSKWEIHLADSAKKFYSRGKVCATLKVKFSGDENGMDNFDKEQICAELERLRRACENAGAVFAPDARLVFEISEKISEKSLSIMSERDSGKIRGLCESALAKAFESAGQMRAAEGENLKADFLTRLAAMSSDVEKIEKISVDVPSSYRDALLRRLKNLGLELDISDERVLKEISVFADKCDISEECTRLASHISQFKTLIGLSEPVGRKLDFLCQEINRESNTVASKANCLDITNLALSLKNNLERLREQVQNVE